MAKKKPPPTYWIFRYFSSRGTDERLCAEMTAGTKATDALESAKGWAERQTAGSACHEYTVTVKRIGHIPKRREWLKEWRRRCDVYNKARDRRDEWRALGDIREFE